MDDEQRRAAVRRATIAFVAAGVLLILNLVAVAVLREDDRDRRLDRIAELRERCIEDGECPRLGAGEGTGRGLGPWDNPGRGPGGYGGHWPDREDGEDRPGRGPSLDDRSSTGDGGDEDDDPSDDPDSGSGPTTTSTTAPTTSTTPAPGP